MPVSEPLKVMTFNVRQMNADDGAQAWQYRKEVLAETIRAYAPSLLGTQETFEEQTAFLLASLPSYAAFGRGRYGDASDEHNKIFYDRHRFSLLESGELWFSQTPEVPGSSDWEIPQPRMMTWGKLHDRSGADILILNTQLPHGRHADEARRQSALLVLHRISALSESLPLFLTGDFNAPAGGEVHEMLTSTLQDSWTTAPKKRGATTTCHGFGKFHGSRIDWILHRNAGRTVSAETIAHRRNGLYPSNHYPVMATFLLGEEPKGNGTRPAKRSSV